MGRGWLTTDLPDLKKDLYIFFYSICIYFSLVFVYPSIMGRGWLTRFARFEKDLYSFFYSICVIF